MSVSVNAQSQGFQQGSWEPDVVRVDSADKTILDLTKSSFGSGMLDSSELAAVIYDLSGLSAQVAEIPKSIEEGFAQSPLVNDSGYPFPADILPDITQSLVDAYNPKALRTTIIDTIMHTLTVDEMQGILTFQRSSLGRRVAELEVKNSVTTTPKQKAEFRFQMSVNPPAKQRLAALKALRDAWDMIESSADMMVNMQVAVSVAMLSHIEGDVSISSVKQQFEQQRSELAKHYAQETLQAMLYVYRDLPVTDINRYRRYLETENGILYVGATNLALHRAMFEASLVLGGKLGELTDKAGRSMTL